MDEAPASKTTDLVAAAGRKQPLIEEAAGTFWTRERWVRARFQNFCQENMSWLPEYASFNVLRRRFGDVAGTSGRRSTRCASTTRWRRC